jgi:dTDP-4-dehydrorhamnose reductase
MLKVWISGANGHLGQALCTRLDREKYQLIATDVAEVDVTVPAEVRCSFAKKQKTD